MEELNPFESLLDRAGLDGKAILEGYVYDWLHYILGKGRYTRAHWDADPMTRTPKIVIENVMESFDIPLLGLSRSRGFVSLADLREIKTVVEGVGWRSLAHTSDFAQTHEDVLTHNSFSGIEGWCANELILRLR